MLLAMLLGSIAAGAALGQTSPSQPVVVEIRTAYDQLASEQVASRPPRSLREKLERLGELDQVGRTAFQRVDLRSLPADEAKSIRAPVWREIEAHDRVNQAELKALMPAQGWFRKSEVGSLAATSAFRVAQHAVNDPDFLRDVLRRMEPLVSAGEADGPAWAEMFDRVALELDNKPQRYGTQVWCRHGEPWTLRELEDPEHVDQRRAGVGIKQTEAEFLAGYGGLCPR